MELCDILTKATYKYQEHVNYERREPQFAIMNENTKELIKSSILSIRSYTELGNIKERLFGIKIAVCDEMGDGIIEFC